MTPAQELRSLHAKLKRRDQRIAHLEEHLSFWHGYAVYWEKRWRQEQDESSALRRDLDEETLTVAGLQAEIAAIHATHAIRAALLKLSPAKEAS